MRRTSDPAALLKKQDYKDFAQELKTITIDQTFRDLINKLEPEFSPTSPSPAIKKVVVNNLIPTQNEIDMTASLYYPLTNSFDSLEKIKNCTLNNDYFQTKYPNGYFIGGPLVLNGEHIIDGHHRWSQVFLVDTSCTMAAYDISQLRKETLPDAQALKASQLAILKGKAANILKWRKRNDIEFADENGKWIKIPYEVAKEGNNLYSTDAAARNATVKDYILKSLAGELPIDIGKDQTRPATSDDLKKILDLWRDILKEPVATPEKTLKEKIVTHILDNIQKMNESNHFDQEAAPKRALMPQTTEIQNEPAFMTLIPNMTSDKNKAILVPEKPNMTAAKKEARLVPEKPNMTIKAKEAKLVPEKKN